MKGDSNYDIGGGRTGPWNPVDGYRHGVNRTRLTFGIMLLLPAMFVRNVWADIYKTLRNT